ncbi:phosphatidylserine decarboxylase [Butyrivibrio sp. AC2005]|uniref:phosphatidylserine decarboxylase n=1 Tax=Butyrivibrio sp. AC2005 TaxID=1280672 RepID=UPI00041020AF|nr:phosphatidylserine decarboxylase [Butyrivibrio sp. AC2005]
MITLELLYKTKIGRILLKPLTIKPLSDLAGRLMDSRASVLFIEPFVQKNGIRKEDYVLEDIHSFNDFFCRKIKSGLRTLCPDENAVIAPCDGYLKVCRITNGTVLNVKQSRFSIRTLLRDKKLADSFEGGYCFVYRLCVEHYHRYIYFTDGFKMPDRSIRGFYHTVRPVALEEIPVFTENSRQYSVIDNDKLGRCVQMEVGAMLVGRIVNEKPGAGKVIKGAEKGHFEFGGSTIIVLIPKGKMKPSKELLDNSRNGKETPVKMGDAVGVGHLLDN